MRVRSRWSIASVIVCLFATSIAASEPYVTRTAMFGVEKKLEASLRNRWHDDPYMFVDLPRGYYVDHVGVLVVAEFTLSPGPGLSPFRGPITKQEVKQHKAAVMERVPQLKDLLKTQLLETAAALNGVPDSDRIVIAVSVYHFDWEDTANVPSQIVVQGVKKNLVAAHADRALRDSAIETKELN